MGIFSGKRGVKLGNPNLRNVRNTDLSAAHRQRKKNADSFAQRVMPEIENLRQAGVSSYARIADAVNKLGSKTRRGGDWTATAVSRVVARTPGKDPLDEMLSWT